MRIALALIVLLVTPAIASGQSGVVIAQEVFDQDGDPLLSAGVYSGDDLDDVEWAICPPPDNVCTPVPRTQPPSGLIAGPQPIGTRFRASLPDGSQDISRPWQGRVTLISPPRLIGKLEVGEQVYPVAGEWSGGWGDDVSELRVQACKKPTGEECVTLFAPSPQTDYPVLFRELTGSYVFAVEARWAAETFFPSIGYFTPYGVPPFKPGPTYSFSATPQPVLDPTATPSATPTATPIDPPGITLRRRTHRYLGIVSCQACEVRLTVRRGVRRWVVNRHVGRDRWLELPKAARKPGWVRVTVDVDGRRIAADDVRVL